MSEANLNQDDDDLLASGRVSLKVQCAQITIACPYCSSSLPSIFFIFILKTTTSVHERTNLSYVAAGDTNMRSTDKQVSLP